VGMSEKASGSVRVGCGHYDWSFERNEPYLVDGLAITIRMMENGGTADRIPSSGDGLVARTAVSVVPGFRGYQANATPRGTRGSSRVHRSKPRLSNLGLKPTNNVYRS